VSAKQLETVELEPSAPADAAVVWMHGLGADGHDFESLVPELRLPAAPSLRFVFPHAPIRPVTINGGMRMRAWYDVVGFDKRAPQDAAGIRESAESLGLLLKRERERGIPAERIVVAGFSQGGAMALQLGLRWPERLAGVIALSTWLPLADTLEAEAHPANAAVPLLLAHGSFDPVVPQAAGEASRDALRALGYDVDWRSYPMPHSLCAQEVEDIRAWLLRTLTKHPLA
jgi:phospholipase/carboxylesterase